MKAGMHGREAAVQLLLRKGARIYEKYDVRVDSKGNDV
jgi:hypothetical protein